MKHCRRIFLSVLGYLSYFGFALLLKVNTEEWQLSNVVLYSYCEVSVPQNAEEHAFSRDQENPQYTRLLKQINYWQIMHALSLMNAGAALPTKEKAL